MAILRGEHLPFCSILPTISKDFWQSVAFADFFQIKMSSRYYMCLRSEIIYLLLLNKLYLSHHLR